MITNFKIFKELWNDKIGYYVILRSGLNNKKWFEFFKNNIGI